jgi:hypothetical protein
MSESSKQSTPLSASDRAYSVILRHAEIALERGQYTDMTTAIDGVCRSKPQLYDLYRQAVSTSTAVRRKS